MHQELKRYKVSCDGKGCKKVSIITSAKPFPLPKGWHRHAGRKHFTECLCSNCYNALDKNEQAKDKFMDARERCKRCNRVASIARGCPTLCDVVSRETIGE